MGGPMTCPTSKASASPATGRKQRSKDSNDINSHLNRPRGGRVESSGTTRQRTAA
jgi:hypothetical protein